MNKMKKDGLENVAGQSIIRNRKGSLKTALLAGIAVVIAIPVILGIASGNSTTENKSSITTTYKTTSAYVTQTTTTKAPITTTITTQTVAPTTTQKVPTSTTAKVVATTTKKATTATTTQIQKSYTVYITNTGAKYHRNGCRYLSKSQIAISEKDAISQGYTPCSVCDP